MPTSSPQKIFGPTVAGRFYTDDPNELRALVDSYLSKGANAPAIPAIPENRRIIALVSPHAGYVYSGGVAGVAFASIRAERARSMRTAVVLSPSHHGRRQYACALPADVYRTPVGQVHVARSIQDALISKGDLVREDEAMFRPEHAIDVQIPFVQLAFPAAQIVPLIVPMMPVERLALLGRMLYEVVGSDPNAILVASSDLSHYFAYDDARTIDNAIVSELERNDTAAVFAKHDERRGPCGVAPIVATWSYLRLFGEAPNGVPTVHRLSVLNSGDSHPQSRDRVVGYGALAISVPV